MDKFEFFITNNLYNFFKVRTRSGTISANHVRIQNAESDKRIEYLFNNFEKENGKLWREAKKISELLYGKKISDPRKSSEEIKREMYYAICDAAKRAVLNVSLPETCSLYTNVSSKGIEAMLERMNAKMMYFAKKTLALPENKAPSESNFFVDGNYFEDFVRAKMPIQTAVELTPLIEKFVEDYDNYFDGILFESPIDDNINYFFSYINALDRVGETLKLKLVLPLNEAFFVNVRNKEIVIEKRSKNSYIDDEVDAFDFLESFSKRIESPTRSVFTIVQKNFPSYRITISKFFYEKNFSEINTKYLKDFLEYTGRELVITDGERRIEASPSSVKLFGASDDSTLFSLYDRLSKEGEVDVDFVRNAKEVKKFEPEKEFKREVEKTIEVQEDFPF